MEKRQNPITPPEEPRLPFVSLVSFFRSGQKIGKPKPSRTAGKQSINQTNRTITETCALPGKMGVVDWLVRCKLVWHVITQVSRHASIKAPSKSHIPPPREMPW